MGDEETEGAASWNKVSVSVNITGRFFQASCTVDSNIACFGGQMKVYCNEFWIYDVSNDEWSQNFPSGELPKERTQATAVFTTLHTGQMIVHAGYCINTGECNDLHCVDVTNLDREYKWTQPEVSGELPPPRYGHSAELVGDDKMVVVHGQSSKEQLKDVWLLAIDTWTWQEVALSGAKPDPRSQHSCSYCPDVGLIVMGGFHRKKRHHNEIWHLKILDPSCTKMEWEAVEPTSSLGLTMEDRSQHIACARGNHVLVFGGYDGTKNKKDMWLYDAPKKAIYEVALKTAPEARCRHSGHIVGNLLLVFCGYDGSKCLAPDMWTFTLGDMDALVQDCQEKEAAKAGLSKEGQVGWCRTVISDMSSTGHQSSLLYPTPPGLPSSLRYDG